MTQNFPSEPHPICMQSSKPCSLHHPKGVWSCWRPIDQIYVHPGLLHDWEWFGQGGGGDSLGHGKTGGELR